MSRESATRVRGPALGLQITAVIVAISMLLMTLSSLLNVGHMGPDPDAPVSGARMLGQVMGVVTSGALGVGYAAVIFFGAMRMKSLRSYGLSMTAAALALNPLCFPGCLLGLPMGIWALVVLLSADVKEAFQADA